MKLPVEIIEPYCDCVYDPCCDAAGMFVHPQPSSARTPRRIQSQYRLFHYRNNRFVYPAS
ncbi:MAG: hypothetical protein ACUVR8_13815 [Acidobacteriota bacterium]